MFSLFFILALALTIFFAVKAKKDDENYVEDCGWFWGALISGIVTAVFLVVIAINCFSLGTAHVIDDKIEMYQSENEGIEGDIDKVVKNYMTYEKDTYSEFKDEDAMNLVSLFPELKSDELVKKQIEVYVENNSKIKQLKEERLELSKSRFLLYFGS